MPKILGESLAEHRSQVRAKVFDAMRTLLYTRGFDAITLSGVASAAGVGRTAIYNHFPDRESLLVAFVENETSQYVIRLREALAAVSDPVEALAVFVRMQLRVLAGRHTPPGAKLNALLSPEAYQRMAEHVDPITTELRTILSRGIASGQMVDEDVDVLITMITASLASREVVDAGSELDNTIETAVRFILRAVGVRVA
ncbi:TetR/AcrR family transcriptional regulator [Kibdelosporangium philippinense]|uniref:TetR/AcrR family transcriptional regulator n=1 Tax=Kibdelosporangium philippinense TaxID=211113 RepID=A0ABS8ZN76_9PSEU|nr:TetR/AcrR family transcriptional regulator [Kibdelosporangium philippinense]MCE7009032.1 TetR/AcrR family transcriptional regulator [Kibdelosporangium philippinense]